MRLLVAIDGQMEKRFQKKSLQDLLPGRETPDFFFLTAHEHDEGWRCVHVDVREVGEVRHNCGFAYAGQGQIMNLSQISGAALSPLAIHFECVQSLVFC